MAVIIGCIIVAALAAIFTFLFLCNERVKGPEVDEICKQCKIKDCPNRGEKYVE